VRIEHLRLGLQPCGFSATTSSHTGWAASSSAKRRNQRPANTGESISVISDTGA
jgi:hypothetical protein